VEEKFRTGIPESLHEPLMKVAYKLLIRDDSTFEELTYTSRTKLGNEVKRPYKVPEISRHLIYIYM
jgi:hypothetical protein